MCVCGGGEHKVHLAQPQSGLHQIQLDESSRHQVQTQGNFKRGGGGGLAGFSSKKGGGGVQPLTREQFVLQINKSCQKGGGGGVRTGPAPETGSQNRRSCQNASVPGTVLRHRIAACMHSIMV